MKYKHLHKTLKIGTMEIKNRLVVPPMDMEKAEVGKVTDESCVFYREITEGGFLGLVTLEYCYVSPEGQDGPRQLSICEDADVEGLSRIAKIVHENGVKIIAQIHHAGSAARRTLTGREVIGPSAVENALFPLTQSKGRELPREMSVQDIERIIRCFLDAAKRAKEAGFDGVEVHSAHAYLLNQFYSPLTNKRQDEYNGDSIEGRTRIHRKIIEGIRKEVGNGFVISVRLGACDYLDGGATESDAVQAAKIFEAAGADMISITGGMSGFFRSWHDNPGYFDHVSEKVKRAVTIPVLLTGGIVDGETAERLLAEGKADMIGIGRALLKDKALPGKIMQA